MKLLFAAIFAASILTMNAQEYTVYVGTYTGPNASKGIYQFGFDAKSGEVTSPVELAAESASPSFLAVHPNGRFLYAVNEAGAGGVSAFAIDPKSRKLTALNSQPSHGADPCHLSVDHEGKNILIANYTGGSVAVYPIAGDGGLKEASSVVQHKGSSSVKGRQDGPHAHCIVLDKTGKYALVADLGQDKVVVYHFNSKSGQLTEAGAGLLKAGSGPRHVALTKDGKRVYVINELGSTVTGFDYDGKTKFTEFQTLSTLPEATPGNSTAEIAIHPNGKFVYGSNRGHNSIAVFAVGADGKLERVQNCSVEGKTPRNFTIDPTGHFLIAANQDSNNITFFKIDGATGKLTYTGKSVQAFKPVCLTFRENK